jgi:ATP-binding cassette subfamily B protein
LFHSSIAENIQYGSKKVVRKKIEEIGKLAYAQDFISQLPNGYDTIVGERGVKLSGGQRQRIAIARAMLKDSPLFILDEATSALDSDSEQKIQEALKILMQKKTVIAIAHRLSTLQSMDRIVFVQGGKIIESGTHDELIVKNGKYARLWNMQAGGFIPE